MYSLVLVLLLIAGTHGWTPRVWLNVSVIENSEVPVIVGSVDVSRYVEEGDIVSYQLVESDAYCASKPCLDVNRTSGVVQVRRSLDREDVCPDIATVHCSLQFGVLAKVRRLGGINSETSIGVSLRLTVEDVNDYAPTFDQSESMHTIEVPEDQRPNSLVQPALPVAVDLDSPAFRATGVTIEPLDSDAFPFELELARISVDGIDLVDRAFLRLRPTASLDRERVSAYSALLRVRDGMPELLTYNTATLTLKILVLDVNDNDPQVAASYNVSVPENLPVGSVVLQINASDPDAGRNGALSFVVAPADRPRVAQQLSLDPTGTVINRRPFNHELKNVYQFAVIVSDAGSPARSATTSVTIHIIDVNDERPQICLVEDESDANAACGIVEGGSPIVVQENLAANTLVAKLRVSDADSSAQYRDLACDQLPIGMPFSLQRLGSDLGKSVHYALRTEAPLDRETQRTYALPLVCSDGNALAAHTVTQTLSVTVGDENDNWPKFNSSRMTVQNYEEEPITIRVLPATDPDAAENGTIRYSLADNFGKFEIDPVTAMVTSNPLDRELQSTYQLVIVATDQGVKRHSASTTYVLSLLDVNDHAPLVKPLYTFHISEDYFQRDRLDAFDLGNLNVSDADDGNNGLFECDMETHGSPLVRPPLSVYTDCRVFFNAVQLDRENTPVYNATVIVRDKGSVKTHSSTTQIRIIVDDVNDCAPEISDPLNGTNVTFYVSLLDASLNQNLVVKVTATDADEPNTPNSQLQFHFAGGSTTTEVFSIDPLSGELRLRANRTLTMHDLAPYRLDVQVRDWGTPQRGSLVWFRVILLELADPAGYTLADRSFANALVFVGIVVGLFIVASILIAAIMFTAQRMRGSAKPSVSKSRTPAKTHVAVGDPSRAPLNAALAYTLEGDSAACSPNGVDPVGCLMCDSLSLTNAKSCFAVPNGANVPGQDVHVCGARSPCVLVTSRVSDRALVEPNTSKEQLSQAQSQAQAQAQQICEHCCSQPYPAFVHMQPGANGTYYTVLPNLQPCHCASDEGFSQTRTSDSNASSVTRFPAVCQEYAMKIDQSTASAQMQMQMQMQTLQHRQASATTLHGRTGTATYALDTLCINDAEYNLNGEDQFPLQPPPASPPMSPCPANAFVPKSLFSNSLRQHTAIMRSANTGSGATLATSAAERDTASPDVNDVAAKAYSTLQSFSRLQFVAEKKNSTTCLQMGTLASSDSNSYINGINNNNNINTNNNSLVKAAPGSVATALQSNFSDSTVV